MAENLGEYIWGEIKNIGKTVAEAVTGETYQSPLELNGIAIRQAKKSISYYNKQYMYAVPIGVDMIRTQDSYVSASGWRPTTYQVKTNIHDNEWSKISSNFEVQTGGGAITQKAITNQGETDTGTAVGSTGRNNNYEPSTKKNISLNSLTDPLK